MILLPTGEGEVEWTSIEAKQLRDFLFSDTGKKMLTLCETQTPTLLDGTDVNRTLVSSGERKGFDLLLEFIFSLTVESPKEVQPISSYPDLDSDAEWAETETSKPTTQES